MKRGSRVAIVKEHVPAARIFHCKAGIGGCYSMVGDISPAVCYFAGLENYEATNTWGKDRDGTGNRISRRLISLVNKLFSGLLFL